MTAVIFALLPVQRSAGASQADDQLLSCALTDNGYTVEICLEAPPTDVVLKDDVIISATASVDDSSIKIRAVIFELDGQRVLSDADAPYTFVLPVSYFEGGRSTLSAYARLSDDSKTIAAERDITIGVSEPLTFGERTFEPPPGRPAEEGESFVVAAVGDSAGGSPQSLAVAELIDSWNPNLLLYLGDVYNSGTYTEFLNWYDAEESMGRFRDITLPTPGNHEYGGKDVPRGYMEYWGNPPHFYSVDTAGWHIVSVDSNPRYDQMHASSEQLQWLEADLSASQTACTIVFFHHPPFSVGAYEDEHATVQYLWDLLVEYDVTLVLSGHDHNYQRWQGLNEDGQIDPNGPVSLVVGTGGHSVYKPKFDDTRLATAALTAPGALRMELNPNGASLQFITTDGVVRDSSSVACATDTNADTSVPSTPTGLSATLEQDGSVALRWDPSRDDTGVAHYEVYRNDSVIADAVSGTTYIDTTLPTTEEMTWTVIAVDAAGNRSAPSDNVSVEARPMADAVFADNFSTGTMDKWDEVNGLTISPMPGNASGNAWVAHAHGSSDPAYATLTLPEDIGPTADTDLVISMRFRVNEQGDNPIVFLRLRNPDRGSLMSVNIGPNQHLGIFNDVTKSGIPSTYLAQSGSWHDLTVRISGPPENRSITISLDGEEVRELSGRIDLGGDQISYLQLGDSTPRRLYDVLYSEVVVRRIPHDEAPSPPASPGAFHTPGSSQSQFSNPSQTSPVAIMIHSHNSLFVSGPMPFSRTSHREPRVVALRRR